jgi:hypothetical protein
MDLDGIPCECCVIDSGGSIEVDTCFPPSEYPFDLSTQNAGSNNSSSILACSWSGVEDEPLPLDSDDEVLTHENTHSSYLLHPTLHPTPYISHLPPLTPHISHLPSQLNILSSTCMMRTMKRYFNIHHQSVKKYTHILFRINKS